MDGLSEDTVAEAEALVEMLEERGNKLRLSISKPPGNPGNGFLETRWPTTGVGPLLCTCQGTVSSCSTDTSRSARAFLPESWRESEGSRQTPNRHCTTRKARTDRTNERHHATYPDQRDKSRGSSRPTNDHQRTCRPRLKEAAESRAGGTHCDETSSSRVRSDAREEAGRTRRIEVSHCATVGGDSTDDLSAVFRSYPKYRIENDGKDGGGVGLGLEAGDHAATGSALQRVKTRGRRLRALGCALAPDGRSGLRQNISVFFECAREFRPDRPLVPWRR